MADHRQTDTTDAKTLPLLGRMFLWTGNKSSVDRLVYGIYGVCALLFLADFFYEKHVYLEIEKFPGFYALYGFFMSAALVICARIMRMFLKRDAEYYAPHDVESEDYPEDQLDKATHDG